MGYVHRVLCTRRRRLVMKNNVIWLWEDERRKEAFEWNMVWRRDERGAEKMTKSGVIGWVGNVCERKRKSWRNAN